MVDAEEWYSFDSGPVHCINIASDARISDDHMARFEHDLAGVDRAVTPWVVVAARRPWDAVDIARLEQTGVDAVIVGADNYYEDLDQNPGQTRPVYWSLPDEESSRVGRLSVLENGALAYEIVNGHGNVFDKAVLMSRHVHSNSKRRRPNLGGITYKRNVPGTPTEQLGPLTTHELLALSNSI